MTDDFAAATPTEDKGMTQYRKYQRTQIAEMADWHDGFDMAGVSMSEPDRANGSPRLGDKIARNPANHADRWLVSAAYFVANFRSVASDEDKDDEQIARAIFDSDLNRGQNFEQERYHYIRLAQAAIAALDAKEKP